MQPVVHPDDILSAQRAVHAVRVDESLLDYIIAIVEDIHRSELLLMGASPQCSLLHSAIAVLGGISRNSLKQLPLSLQLPENMFVGEKVFVKISMSG